MNAQLKNRLILTAVFAVLGTTGMVMNSRRAAAQGPSDGLAVRIVNPVPVPITGSVTASGTVAATQSGPWNVGIAGNSEAKPLWTTDADNPARNPFVLNGNLLSGGSATAFATLGQVPAGRRYVIEQYSAECLTDANATLTDISVANGVNSDDSATPHHLGGGSWHGSGNTRLYAGPGAPINVAATSTGGNISSCEGFVSGYSVAVP